MSSSGSARRPCRAYIPRDSHKVNIYPPHFTFVKYILDNLISAVFVTSFLACIRQLKWNTPFQTVSVGTTVLTSDVIPITDRRQLSDFPVCNLKPPIRPRFQPYGSVRAPPIYPHLLAKTNFHVFRTYALRWNGGVERSAA